MFSDRQQLTTHAVSVVIDLDTPEHDTSKHDPEMSIITAKYWRVSWKVAAATMRSNMRNLRGARRDSISSYFHCLFSFRIY